MTATSSPEGTAASAVQAAASRHVGVGAAEGWGTWADAALGDAAGARHNSQPQPPTARVLRELLLRSHRQRQRRLPGMWNASHQEFAMRGMIAGQEDQADVND